eukprot:scaffold442_cov397-Prasinococcus_capsulatus_cf.AAC.61
MPADTPHMYATAQRRSSSERARAAGSLVLGSPGSWSVSALQHLAVPSSSSSSYLPLQHVDDAPRRGASDRRPRALRLRAAGAAAAAAAAAADEGVSRSSRRRPAPARPIGGGTAAKGRLGRRRPQ